MRDQLWGNRSHTAWRWLTFIAAAVLAVAPAGCAYQGIAKTPMSADEDSAKPTILLFGNSTLTRANPTSAAVTYNPDLAPVGAALTGILIPSSAGSTNVVFTASGLLPNRGYAVHVHSKACGVNPAESGPHFQNHLDPVATPQSPSSDPRYANPNNEIWLDLRTDAAGAAISRATVPFIFTDRVPASIVVHEAMQTSTGPGNAGKAGARIACLTLSGR